MSSKVLLPTAEDPWVDLLVNTICNRKCPECCCRIPTHETLAPQHYTWDVFERAAEAFRGYSTLFVSGGEPTLHPEFRRFGELRKMFQCSRMVLVTNGFRLAEHRRHLRCFDQICLTAFDDGISQESVDMVRRDLRPHQDLEVGRANHTPLSKFGKGGRCQRYHIATCAGDRVWPCCIGPGMKDAPSMLIDGKCGGLFDLGTPCDRCPFSVDLSSAAVSAGA